MSRDVGTTARKVTTRDRLAIWERDKGACRKCGLVIPPGKRQWVLEHVRALELGGTNEPANLAVFCWDCAHEKTKDDHARTAKAKRAKAAHIGAKTAPAKPLQSAGFTPAPKQLKASKPIDKLAALPRRSMFR